jgi:hypothetical protein
MQFWEEGTCHSLSVTRALDGERLGDLRDRREVIDVSPAEALSPDRLAIHGDGNGETRRMITGNQCARAASLPR